MLVIASTMRSNGMIKEHNHQSLRSMCSGEKQCSLSYLKCSHDCEGHNDACMKLHISFIMFTSVLFIKPLMKKTCSTTQNKCTSPITTTNNTTLNNIPRLKITINTLHNNCRWILILILPCTGLFLKRSMDVT